jgi:hypothetical protein
MEVAADFRIGSKHGIQLALAPYDCRRPLLIDPSIDFVSYFGGPGSESVGRLRIDGDGNLLMSGASQSQVAPTLDPFSQPSLIVWSPYIFKFTPDGSKLLFYVTIAVDAFTRATGLAVDGAGNLLLTGWTSALQLPLKNAVDSQFQAKLYTGYATKFASDGRTIVYSTYFGGSGDDMPFGGAEVDAAGNLYFAGQTSSQDLPIRNALQPVHGGGAVKTLVGLIPLGGPMDCYIGKLAPDGRIVYSTYLGGTHSDYCSAIAVAPDGTVIVTGVSNSNDFPVVNAIQTSMYTAQRVPENYTTPFIAKLQADGQGLVFSTFFAGNVFGQIQATALDVAGNIYVAGYLSAGLTTKNAFVDTSTLLSPFAAKLDSSGQNILYSTYLYNNTSPTIANLIDSIVAAPDGSLYLAGSTNAPDFPLWHPIQSHFQGGGITNSDFFLTRIAPGGSSLVFSTYLGGNGMDSGPTLALAPDGHLYFAGNTQSTNIQTQNAFQSSFGGATDIVFARITDDSVVQSPPFPVSAAALAYRYVQGAAAPDPQTILVQSSPYTSASDQPWLTTVVSSDDATQLKVSADPTGLDPGVYHATLTLADASGGTVTVQVALTVLGAPPRLDAVSPNSIAVGSDDTEITFTGAGFGPNTTVLFGGVAFPGFQAKVDDGGTLRCTIPRSYLKNPGVLLFSLQNPQSAASQQLPVLVQ